MKFGGTLSENIKEAYAVCHRCEVIYKDDIPIMGPSVWCPTCDCAVVRGISRKEAKDLADESLQELFS